MTPDTYRILHDIPGRLRLRIPEAVCSRAKAAELRAWTAAFPGVETVRVNASAATMIVAYDRDRVASRSLMTRISSLNPDRSDPPMAIHATAPDIVPVVRSLLNMLLVPHLPGPLQRSLIAANLATRLSHGIEALAHQGPVVDVIDSLVAATASARGRPDVASRTGLLVSITRYLYQCRVDQPPAP
jgi:manganese/zinc-transporting P-type ATPase C